MKTRRFAAEILLWVLFLLISAGLGYPTLNRYDPRKQLPDAAVYAQIATSASATVETHFRFRVLVPFFAHLVSKVAHGHTGTWDPLMFSFLLVNASLVATTAYLLCRVGRAELASRPVALFGAALHLLNFAVANLQLAGLVDAAEACLLMAVIASMFYRRWFLLPAVGFVGSFAKESFIPFSIVMVVTWWFASDQRSRRAAAWITAMALVEIVTLTVLQCFLLGRAVWPWMFALNMRSETGFVSNLIHSVLDRNSWYILVWLLPLGLAGLKPVAWQWRAAVAAGTITALLLNAYHSTVGGGGGGIGRYIFDVAGPLLSLAAASFLSKGDSRQAIALD
jgi:hypothetical protein